MKKTTHNSQEATGFTFGDDMHVLNVLVESVRGLRPVSGSFSELGLPDPDLLDELGVELV